MAQRKQREILTSLKTARKEFGITQQELAKKTGIPRTTIAKIEAGFRNTTLSTMLDLAKAVNLDLKLVKQEIIKKAKSFERTFDTLNNIYIDSSAIISNYNFFKTQLPNHQFWPVLKANAYGHGIEEIATILNKVRPDFLVVDGYYEALKIWKVNPQQKVLLIGAILPTNYPIINYAKTSLMVSDESVLSLLAKQSKEVNIHLKINSGFNRQGISIEEIESFCQTLRKYPNIKLEGVMSHLANADEKDNSFNKKQEEIFDQALSIIKKNGFKPKYKHLSATAGVFTTRNKNTNAVRLGIGLYGYNPLPINHKMYKKIKIRPALTLTSSITNINYLEKGDQVSYGGTFVVPKKMTVGVLPLGYYEALDRKLSNQGYIKLANKLYPIVGRICMNMTIFDLGESKASLYDQVKVISTNPSDKNSVGQIAQMVDTIPYEVLTRLSENIRRTIV